MKKIKTFWSKLLGFTLVFFLVAVSGVIYQTYSSSIQASELNVLSETTGLETLTADPNLEVIYESILGSSIVDRPTNTNFIVQIGANTGSGLYSPTLHSTGLLQSQAITYTNNNQGYYGQFVRLNNNSSISGNFLTGGHFQTESLTDINDLEGFAGVAKVTNSNGNASIHRNMRALYLETGSENNGVKNVGTSMGSWIRSSYTGGAITINKQYGVFLDNRNAPGTEFTGGFSSATVNSLYGFYYSSPKDGNISNEYGVFIENVGDEANNYAIFSEGGKSYFGGKVGIGKIPSGGNMLDVQGNVSVSRNLVVGTKLVLNKGAGKALIQQGTTSIVVNDSTVTDRSIISVTPNEFVMYKVVNKIPGKSFTIQINKVLEKDVSFDYIIVN